MINLVKFDLADGYSFVCAHLFSPSSSKPPKFSAIS